MKYPDKESATLEFKRDVPSRKQIMLKTVVGFTNTYGGQIVVGIDDSHEIIGIPEALVDQLTDDITRAIYDSISKYSVNPSCCQNTVIPRSSRGMTVLGSMTG